MERLLAYLGVRQNPTLTEAVGPAPRLPSGRKTYWGLLHAGSSAGPGRLAWAALAAARYAVATLEAEGRLHALPGLDVLEGLLEAAGRVLRREGGEDLDGLRASFEVLEAQMLALTGSERSSLWGYEGWQALPTTQHGALSAAFAAYHAARLAQGPGPGSVYTAMEVAAHAAEALRGGFSTSSMRVWQRGRGDEAEAQILAVLRAALVAP